MAIVQSFKESFAHYYEQFKIFVFGENNERLDKIITHFYSMREEKRILTKRISIISGIVGFALIMFMYFYSLFQLQNNLDYATSAYLKIQELKPNFMWAKQEYDQISSKLVVENTADKIIPAISQTAHELSLELTNLPDKPTLMSQQMKTSLLSTQFQKEKIEFQINGVSIKKLTDFLNELYKKPNKFALTKLEINQMTENNKLYFNTAIGLEVFVPK